MKTRRFGRIQIAYSAVLDHGDGKDLSSYPLPIKIAGEILKNPFRRDPNLTLFVLFRYSEVLQ